MTLQLRSASSWFYRTGHSRSKVERISGIADCGAFFGRGSCQFERHLEGVATEWGSMNKHLKCPYSTLAVSWDIPPAAEPYTRLGEGRGTCTSTSNGTKTHRHRCACVLQLRTLSGASGRVEMTECIMHLCRRGLILHGKLPYICI